MSEHFRRRVYEPRTLGITDHLKSFHVFPKDARSEWKLDIDPKKIEAHGLGFASTLILGMKGSGLISNEDTENIFYDLIDHDFLHIGRNASETQGHLEDVLRELGINNILLKDLVAGGRFGGLEMRMKNELNEGSAVAISVHNASLLLLPGLFTDKNKEGMTIERVEVIAPFPVPIVVASDLRKTKPDYVYTSIPDTATGECKKVNLRRVAIKLEASRGQAIAVNSRPMLAEINEADL